MTNIPCAPAKPEIGKPFNPSRNVCGFYPPDIVGRQRDLTDGQKRPYERAVRWAGNNGCFWYGFDAMAGELGKCVRQVKADMAELEAYGLISHQRRRRQSNRYLFLWHPILKVQSTAHQDGVLEVQDTVNNEVLEVQSTARELCNSSLNCVRRISSSGFSYSVAREETAVKHDDEEATFSQNEQTPEPPAGVELPAAGDDENLPEVENGKTPDLVATVPAVTRNPEDLAALVETARGQLRMARAASMDLTGVVTTENLDATSPPDGKITVDILEAFRGYADFELWLKDTVTRGLGRKAKSAGYAFYLADARREVPRVALARRRMDAEAAREREQDAAEAATVAELDTPMRAIEAFGRIQGRLAGREVPRPVKARLERTGERISPNALEAAIRGWKRCAHCGDGGTVGNALDRTLAFCACAAGIEAGYDKGACWPTEETARVHANVKSLLVAACFAVEQPFVADAIGNSEVTDDGETLKIALPAAHFGIREADVRPAAERLGWQRRIVITGGRQFSKPAPAAKPEAAAAPLFKAITQADIDRELELAKRRKPPRMEPIGDWIGGTVQ